MEINKNDIKKLDFIIDKILDINYSIGNPELFRAKLIISTNFKENEFEFKRLLNFIKYFDVAKITENNTIGDKVEINRNTLNFKKQGGFATLYEKQQSKINNDNRLTGIKEKKLEDDAKLSNLQVKTFWWIFSFGIIGGVYAIISIVVSLTGETTEQKIQHIIESKLKAQPKIENTLITPNIKKTLFVI